MSLSSMPRSAHLLLCLLFPVAVRALRAPAPHNSLQVPRMTPTGRTVYSSNPAESAAFILKYVKTARAAPSPADTRLVALSNFTLFFVRPECQDSEQAVAELSEAWAGMLDPDSPVLYSEWVNYHDGILCHMHRDVLNLGRMHNDGVETFTRGDIRRVLVPSTAYTLEIFVLHSLQVGDDSEDGVCQDDSEVSERHYRDGDACRVDNQGEAFGTELGWFKSTYASTDPAATMRFAIEVFGAYQVNDPYPWPPQDGCQAARWVKVPGLKTMLHFVDSSHAYPSTGNFTLGRFVESVTTSTPCGNYADWNVDNLTSFALLLAASDYEYVIKDEQEGCVLYTHLVATAFLVRSPSAWPCRSLGFANDDFAVPALA